MFHRSVFFVAFTALAIGIVGGATANAQYYYSAPAYSPALAANAYYGQPYGYYNKWFTGSPPTFREYSAAANRGPNQAFVRARNQATGSRPGRGVSSARRRDDILRAKAYTQARGFTCSNGPVRGLWGAAIRSAARD